MPAVTFTEVLPPSKSHPHRALKYTPACVGVGVLELTDSRSHTRYAVAVQPYGGVRMSKADGESYVVTAGTCECKGFVFGRGALCRHIAALHALQANQWLEVAGDELETVRDQDADLQERDEWFCKALGGAKVEHEPLGC